MAKNHLVFSQLMYYMYISIYTKVCVETEDIAL